MSREWVWAHSPSGRESAFTRVRHVLVASDPYSGFGTTACDKPSRDAWGHKTDEDIAISEREDGIPPDLCATCDKRTRETT